MAAFVDTGSEGGGGGGGVAGGGGGGGSGNTFGIIPDAWLGIGQDRTQQAWDNPRNIARLLGISVEAYKQSDREQRKAFRHQAKLAFTLQRERAQGDERGLARVLRIAETVGALQRSPDFWRLPREQRSEALRAARAAARPTPASPPPQSFPNQVPGSTGPTQRPPGPLSQSALDEWARLLALVRDWWLQREQQREAEREARRLRRQLQQQQGATMPLGDILGGISSIASALTPSVQAIYAERAAREMRRAGFATGASGVPVGGVVPAMGNFGGLEQYLGGASPGQLEQGGALETLEREVERDAVLWKRPSIGGRATPVRNLYARNPNTGQLAVWTYAGQPVLFSGDLATCRRVSRIVRRSAGRVGLRFRRRGRR